MPFPETASEKSQLQTAPETAQKWAACIQELGAHHRTMGNWLQGSELLPTGQMQDNKPLYRLLVVDKRSVEWLKQQAQRAICISLRGALGSPVAIDITAELQVTP